METLSAKPTEQEGPELLVVDGRRAEVYAIPLGAARLVLARGQSGGVLGCGAIDPAPLGRLGIAAARVRPTGGPSIAGAEDLLAGEVREANDAARALGVVPGMSGREALRRL